MLSFMMMVLLTLILLEMQFVCWIVLIDTACSISCRIVSLFHVMLSDCFVACVLFWLCVVLFCKPVDDSLLSCFHMSCYYYQQMTVFPDLKGK